MLEIILGLLPFVLLIGATQLGTNRTLHDTPTIANRMAAGLFDGRVKIAYDDFTFAGELAGEVIEMCPPLPKGAKIIEVILETADLGNNVELEVGDYEDANRYITATDHGAGAALITRLNAIAGRMYTIDETYTGVVVGSGSDRQITVTTSVAAATGEMKLIVLYTHD